MPLRGPSFHCTPPRLRRVNATGTHPVGLHRGLVVLRLQWTRLRHVNLTGIPSGFAEVKPGLRFGSSWLRLVNLTGSSRWVVHRMLRAPLVQLKASPGKPDGVVGSASYVLGCKVTDFDAQLMASPGKPKAGLRSCRC